MITLALYQRIAKSWEFSISQYIPTENLGYIGDIWVKFGI